MRLQYIPPTFVSLIVCLILSATCELRAEDPVSLAPGSRVVIIGNTLAERMQYYGNFETKLQQHFPNHQLRVRNLGWSAEEVGFGWAAGDESKLFRSRDFADHGHRLKDHAPDLVIACFGFNESFGGDEKLPAFRDDLAKTLNYLTKTTFNGKAPPTVVLVTPLPLEAHPSLTPEHVAQCNERLARYSSAMIEVAKAAQVRCVDAFQLMQSKIADPNTQYTINGVHLTAAGDEQFSRVLEAAIFGDAIQGPLAQKQPNQFLNTSALREAVLEKDRRFFYDYRAVNGYYIYGGRKSPYGIVNYPAEFTKLRKMIDLRDQRIWAIAQGKQVPEKIDDSGTGELLRIESNVDREVRCLTPEEQLATFKVPEGFVVELYASEREFPELAKPCQIAIDAKGRIWTCTMPTYPQYLPGEEPHDQILIFEDSDGDGKADRRTIFADGLHLPTGFEIGDGGAYVAEQPNLLFLADRDGDDRAESREIVLHGFDSADSHHSISAFVWGPGGELYFQEGTFHHSQVETPYGPQRVKDAAVFRYEPRANKLEVYVSYLFANPWGHCFDPWGQDFVADASTGFNYFAAAFSGQVIYPQKHRSMKTFLEKQWRPTAGCTLVSSNNFPPEMQGDFLITNCIGFQGVLQYRMKEEGSGFHAEPVEPLLSSTDPAFRPVDVRIGHDGAAYVCDWYNPLVGHMQHSLRDPKRDKSHGRIWRIRYAGRPLQTAPKIAGASLDQLVRTLESDIDQHRAAARAELRVRPTTEVLAALDGWLSANKDHPNLQHHRLEALWVQQHHRSVQQPLLEQLLTSPEPKARAAAVRALCYLRDEFKSSTDWFVRAANDEHPRVRLEAVRAASFLAGADGDRVLNAALEHPLDYYLQYTITETSDTLEMRGGRPGGTSAAAVERLAAGEVPDAQVLPLVQLSVTNADARAFGRLFAATMEPKAYSVSTKLAVIRLLQREAEVRKLLPPVRKDKFLDQIRTALSASDVPLAAALLQLAEAWKIPDLVSDMRTLILEQRPDPAVVSAALGIVAADTSPGAGMLLNELSTNPQNPKLTVQVAQAMSGRDAKRAITILIRGLEQGAGFEDTRPAIEALLRQQNGSKELTKALRGGKLSPDPARVLLRALFAVGNSDQDLAAVVSEAAGINSKSEPLTDAQRIALARRIDQEGDADAGQWVFRRTELNCTKCHMLSGGGGNIGPDLSAVGANSPTEYLIDSMLHPSKQIKEAFLTRKILTTSGQVVVGIRVDANDQRVVLRDIEGKEVTIAQNDIEEDLEGPSLMPEGLANFLTEREFIDLVKFLSVLGKPGPYAINNRLTAQRFWLLTDQQIRKDLAKAEEGKLESSLASLSKIVYEPRLALVDGRLPKAEIVPADVQLPIILRFDFKVTVAGALGIRVEPASDVQLVINGQSLSPSGQQAIDLPAGDHSAFLIYERNAPTADITVELVRPSATTIQVSRP